MQEDAADKPMQSQVMSTYAEVVHSQWNIENGREVARRKVDAKCSVIGYSVWVNVRIQ